MQTAGAIAKLLGLHIALRIAYYLLVVLPGDSARSDLWYPVAIYSAVIGHPLVFGGVARRFLGLPAGFTILCCAGIILGEAYALSFFGGRGFQTPFLFPVFLGCLLFSAAGWYGANRWLSEGRDLK